ncbi:MAG TPA: ABC transporter ATP-binding protein [Candidatus Baltobacteraceae bacterium]|nr:ABC transporter ATP-binding protein [Candidatus Baltobacteraceae bacterium]
MLRIRGVGKSYRHGLFARRTQTSVLHDVTFDASPGEIVGVAGANGAGKTTLLHVIAGLVLAERGSVELDGRPLTPARAQREVALCSSADRSFYYRLTLRDNLRFFGRLYGLSGGELNDRIAQALERMDLIAQSGKRYSRCSTGTRQRLTFARALLSDAPVLLLDEPTRAVDPLHTQRLHEFIRNDLALEARKIVVLATNQLDEAWGVCDRVVLLSGGKTVAVDTPDVLRRFTAEQLFAAGATL